MMHDKSFCLFIFSGAPGSCVYVLSAHAQLHCIAGLW